MVGSDELSLRDTFFYDDDNSDKCDRVMMMMMG